MGDAPEETDAAELAECADRLGEGGISAEPSPFVGLNGESDTSEVFLDDFPQGVFGFASRKGVHDVSVLEELESWQAEDALS